MTESWSSAHASSVRPQGWRVPSACSDRIRLPWKTEGVRVKAIRRRDVWVHVTAELVELMPPVTRAPLVDVGEGRANRASSSFPRRAAKVVRVVTVRLMRGRSIPLQTG